MDLLRLADAFDESKIQWRVGRGGVKDKRAWAYIMPYIDAREAMKRLDEVCGPENWSDSYQVHNDSGHCTCSVSIKFGDEWVSKSDGSGGTDFESVKGGMSDAFKRACVKWGIARYLYYSGEIRADIVEKGHPGANYQKDKKSGEIYYWAVPAEAKNVLEKATKRSRIIPGEPEFSKLCSAELAKIGCRTPDDANLVCRFLTNGTCQTHEVFKKNPGVAKTLYGLLISSPDPNSILRFAREKQELES